MEKNDSVIVAFKNPIQPINGETNSYIYSGSKLVSSMGFSVSFPIKVGNYYSSILTDYVVWDVFNTGSILAIPQTFEKITCANDLLPYVYSTSMKIATTTDGTSYSRLLDSNVPHNYVMTINVPTYKKVTFNRCKYEGIDGWLIKTEDIFHLSDQTEDKQTNTPLIKASLDASNLDEYIKKITKGIKSNFGENVKVSKLVDWNKAITQSNGQFQFDFDTQENRIDEGKNMNNTSYPVCQHLTISTDTVSITSKNYAYANKPANFASCCHSSVAVQDKLTPCAFGGGSKQQSCPFYVPFSQTIKTYNSQDSTISYSAVKILSNNGSYIVNIYNANNNSIAYCLMPPADATDDQIIQEVDGIIQEVISSWPSEIVENFQAHAVAPEFQEVKQKKSFILSLV